MHVCLCFFNVCARLFVCLLIHQNNLQNKQNQRTEICKPKHNINITISILIQQNNMFNYKHKHVDELGAVFFK